MKSRFRGHHFQSIIDRVLQDGLLIFQKSSGAKNEESRRESNFRLAAI
jgi:hypothetical protein